MTAKNSKGEPIYSCPLSKEYKEGYDKIKWSKPKKSYIRKKTGDKS